MVSASHNDQKYPRYLLVLKLNATLARPLRLVILYFFKWKFLSDDQRLYLHDSKLNSKSDVDGLTHTKQLLNLLCIVYICQLFFMRNTFMKFQNPNYIFERTQRRPNGRTDGRTSTKLDATAAFSKLGAFASSIALCQRIDVMAPIQSIPIP